MSQEQHEPRKPHSIPTRTLIGVILLTLGILFWIALVIIGFQLQDMVGKNLRLIMELAESAGAG